MDDFANFERDAESAYRDVAPFLGSPAIPSAALARIRAAVLEEGTRGAWSAAAGSGGVRRIGWAVAACAAAMLATSFQSLRLAKPLDSTSLLAEAEGDVKDWIDAAIESGHQLTLLQSQSARNIDLFDVQPGDEAILESLESVDDSFEALEAFFGA